MSASITPPITNAAREKNRDMALPPSVEQIELAWAAGFFDGEGCVGCYDTRAVRGRGHGKGAIRLMMAISQTPTTASCVPDVLCRFRQAVGSGRIGAVHPQPERSFPNGRPHYRLSISGAEDVRTVYDKLRPYLSEVKRAQFELALKRWDDRFVEFPRIRPGPALKTHCVNGHAFDETNTGWYLGRRYCRACRAASERRRKARLRAQRR